MVAHHSAGREIVNQKEKFLPHAKSITYIIITQVARELQPRLLQQKPEAKQQSKAKQSNNIERLQNTSLSTIHPTKLNNESIER
jgi:hypothetical protein